MGWSSLRAVFSQTRHFTVITFTDANMYAISKSDGYEPKSLTLHLPVLS